MSAAVTCAASNLLTEKPAQADFPLVTDDGAAAICFSETDAKVVGIAARDLAADIERVTGKRPQLAANSEAGIPDTPAVIIGTLGQSPLIDALAASGKFDASEIRGKWETFLITAPDSRTLVIAGSDRRGTAYGVYELSQAIGVSPWHWWADVTPRKKSTLHIAAGARRFGPPSVKYRGIFINDEDWGLQPWAEKTFEPENKGIGPKTYGKIFELLLRLKANTLWPAMRKGTPAFNGNPANAALADDYAIVMGSSHAGPMLRNNAGEWSAPAARYNYAANRDGVLAYWEERVKANGRYENIYTLGMRGINDGALPGGGTREEQIARLEKILDDQRALIEKHAAPARSADVENIPQIFCAFDESLALYRAGLRVPDDVTVMFPDDNFGYIRDFPRAGERARPGGFGVYYHLSYLGKPLSYLWLCTTPPGVIYEEMRKAYDLGANRVWIVNVGDIKPAEIATEFFLQLAWDIERWKSDAALVFLNAWAAREFGPETAREIVDLLLNYYIFNFERRPEHLQWWLPGEKPRPSNLSEEERNHRQALALLMNERLANIRTRIPPEKQDAFYELVEYPVQGSILANNRYFTGEEAALKYLSGDKSALNTLGYMGDVLNGQLARITHRYNNLTAGGKWRGIMQLEPADTQWKSMRISPWRVPNFQLPLPLPPKPAIAVLQSAESHAHDRHPEWHDVIFAGRKGTVRAIMPPNTSPVSASRENNGAPILIYNYTLTAQPGDAHLRIHILPAYPINGSGKLRIAYSFDGGQKIKVAELAVRDDDAGWAQAVLENQRAFDIKMPAAALTPGKHTLHLHGIDPGVVIDHVTIESGNGF